MEGKAVKHPKEWLAAAEKASFKDAVMLRVIAEIQRDAREGMVEIEHWHEPFDSRLSVEAEDAIRRYHDFAQTHLASDNRREIRSMLIAFGKFSRQGMVPASELFDMLEAFRYPSPRTAHRVTELLAKYPLFKQGEARS